MFQLSCALTIVVLLFNGIYVDSKIKEWVPNINWDNPKMWQNNQTPCDFENILFPRNIEAVVELPELLKVNSIILPNNGYFVLNLLTSIIISGEPEADGSVKTCDKNSKDNIYLNPVADKWFLSRNWKNTYFERLDTNNNPAVPHQELIPCNNDQVVFPAENNVLVDFEDAPNVLLNSVIFKNNIQLLQFVQFSTTQLGRVMLRNSDHTTIVMRRCFGDRDHCACHQSVEQYNLMGILCRNEQQYCEKPLCLNPIKPIGHCCNICGSIALIKNQRLAKYIRDMVEKMNNEAEIQVHTYVSIVSNGTKESNNLVVQVIAIDRNEYQAASVNFIQNFTSILQSVYKSEVVSVQSSGHPYNPQNYNVWSIVIGSFSLIAIIYVALYMYYERSDQTLFTKWLPSFRLNDYGFFNRPFVFARFENRDNESEYENITVGMEAAPSVLDLAAPSAFKNPIYEKTMSHYDEPKSLKVSTSFEASSKAHKDDDAETDLEEINIENIE